MRRVLATLLAVVVGLVAGGAPAQARPLPAEATCAGVWVVVDGSALDGGTSTTACATTFDTGTDALRSAGFQVGRSTGMICSIDGRPNPCRVTAEAYWSYWQAARSADGSYGPWVYAQLGPDAYEPKQGDAEGWAFGAGAPPKVRPPDAAGASAPATSSAPVTSSPGAVPSPSASTMPAAGGDPTGSLVTAGLVVVAALAVGGWWWTTRRRG